MAHQMDVEEVRLALLVDEAAVREQELLNDAEKSQKVLQMDVEGVGDFVEEAAADFVERVAADFVEEVVVDFVERVAVGFVEGAAADFVEGVAVGFVEGAAADFVEGVAVGFVEGVAVDSVWSAAVDFVEGIAVDFSENDVDVVGDAENVEEVPLAPLMDAAAVPDLPKDVEDVEEP